MHKGKGGEHYKQNGEREVCELMEYEAVEVFLRESREGNHTVGSIKRALSSRSRKKLRTIDTDRRQDNG